MRIVVLLLFISFSFPLEAISRREAIGLFMSAACYMGTDIYKRNCRQKPLVSLESALPSRFNDALVEIHLPLGKLQGRKICEGQLVGNRYTIVTSAHCSNLAERGFVKVLAKRWNSTGRIWAFNPQLNRSLKTVSCALEKNENETIGTILKNLTHTVGFMSHQDLAVIQLEQKAPEWVAPIPLNQENTKSVHSSELSYVRFSSSQGGFWSSGFSNSEEITLVQRSWPILAMNSKKPMCTSMSGGGLFRIKENQAQLIGLASAFVGPYKEKTVKRSLKLSCTIPTEPLSKNYFFLVSTFNSWLKDAILHTNNKNLASLESKAYEIPRNWIKVKPDNIVKAKLRCTSKDNSFKIEAKINPHASMGEIKDVMGHDFWIESQGQKTYLLGIRNQQNKTWNEAGFYFPEQNFDSFLYDPEQQQALYLQMSKKETNVYQLDCTSK